MACKKICCPESLSTHDTQSMQPPFPILALCPAIVSLVFHLHTPTCWVIWLMEATFVEISSWVEQIQFRDWRSDFHMKLYFVPDNQCERELWNLAVCSRPDAKRKPHIIQSWSIYFCFLHVTLYNCYMQKQSLAVFVKYPWRIARFCLMVPPDRAEPEVICPFLNRKGQKWMTS